MLLGETGRIEAIRAWLVVFIVDRRTVVLAADAVDGRLEADAIALEVVVLVTAQTADVDHAVFIGLDLGGAGGLLGFRAARASARLFFCVGFGIRLGLGLFLIEAGLVETEVVV